ncbi:hypothetical protein Bhyg_09671 [Pseudolycoriella hygida]|uniref:Uncharacterized protein n=1 Tax=Pseudolycoriella hygida TaxID=35572 RepID=A0A9Q0RWN3_9DIPT|nr:hypothetical protein Bhyg_09671 [Pseudolycoriella hygida]
MLQNKCNLLHNNWNILILLIILPCGMSHKENQMDPVDSYYIHHQKLANRMKNYIARLPFDDADQGNFHKISKQSDGKFNNQPILHNFNKVQQRHQTPHMSDDKFMNRQLSHKHWG